MSARAEAGRELARRIREVLGHNRPTAAERRRATEALAHLETSLLAAEDDVKAARPVLERMADVNCSRRRTWPDGPTCASPVAAERLPRAEWCAPCIARELLR